MGRPLSRTFAAALLIVLAGSVAAFAAPPAAPPAAKEPPELPKFEEVQALVEKELAKRSGYQRGDLLARTDVAPLFSELEKIGWNVSGRGSLEEKLLPDSDVLVRELRGKNATGFMRHVSKIPAGFDRVDRLRRMPYGQQRLAELIRGPDGHLLIQYLATTPSGKRTGSSIAQGMNGQDFNQRTGRVYTETQWIEELRAAHSRDAAERAKAAPRKK